MYRAPWPVRALALLVSLALVLVTNGAALAVAEDYASREELPLGATVGSLDVSGMTRAEARSLVERQIAAALRDTVTVSVGPQTFTLDAGRFVAVDVAAMVDDAFAPQATSALPERVAQRLGDLPVGGHAGVATTIDEAALADWLDGIASAVETTAANAAYSISNRGVTVVPSRAGATLDRAAALRRLADALAAGEDRVTLELATTRPAVTEADLGRLICIDKSERRLRFYDRGELVKTYVVTVGRPAYPTPTGTFHITLKRYMPSWGNPGSAWARTMPAYIPPGPGNPLGTRALNLDIPGIRIHGTWNDPYIGTATSHGCIRMHRTDIEELFERVEVGDPVCIVD